MNRRDDLDRLYKQSNVLQHMAQAFFYVNMIAGVTAPFLPDEDIFLRIVGIVQGVSAFLFLALALLDDCFCWYEAEAARREKDVENAFGVSLGELTTEGYYNNSLPTSLGKFALNAMESTYFSENIAQKMLPKVLIKALLAITVMIVSAFAVTDLSFLIIIVQAAFTAYFIGDAVQLLRYKGLVKSLFDSLYMLFITSGITTKEQETAAFMAALEYEAVKAHFKIRLDSKVFKANNEMLSVKWNDMLEHVRVPLYAEQED